MAQNPPPIERPDLHRVRLLRALELNRAGLTLETLHADVFGRRITPYEVGTLVFDLWAEGLALTFRAADGAPSVRPDDLRRLRARSRALAQQGSMP